MQFHVVINYCALVVRPILVMINDFLWINNIILEAMNV